MSRRRAPHPRPLLGVLLVLGACVLLVLPPAAAHGPPETVTALYLQSEPGTVEGADDLGEVRLLAPTPPAGPPATDAATSEPVGTVLGEDANLSWYHNHAWPLEGQLTGPTTAEVDVQSSLGAQFEVRAVLAHVDSEGAVSEFAEDAQTVELAAGEERALTFEFDTTGQTLPEGAVLEFRLEMQGLVGRADVHYGDPEDPKGLTAFPHAVVDTDGDGIADTLERQAGTDPQAADTDDDGLTDAQEAHEGTDPGQADTDGDGLHGGEEVDAGTDPTRADTDEDGVDDATELARGTDPNDAADTPGAQPNEGDATRDNDEAAGALDLGPFTGQSADREAAVGYTLLFALLAGLVSTLALFGRFVL